MMTNEEIGKLLREVAAAYVLKNESHFKIIAYERAAENIENSVNEVFDLYKEGKLNLIPGIGVSLTGYLKELCQTGKVNHFQELMKDLPPAMFPLLTVSGFGPKKAYKLTTILKLNNPKTAINDLEKAVKDGKIAEIEGFGEKSQEDILLAINAYKKGQSKENRINLAELREDAGEIEAALGHNLPKLVKLEDIKGDLHVHSSYPIEPSHDTGADPMEIFLKKAETLNYEYLGFSEHSPSLSKHSKEQIYGIMLRRKKVIEQLKLTSKSVRVINLLEVDILTDGNLSIENKSLALIDGAIASIHSGFDQPRETMTKRILQALANDKVRILGHPTGRKLGKREPCEADWERIFNFCRKKDKAVEINACPQRLDLPDTLIRKAVKMGVKMVINTDSHEVGSLDLMEFGVFMAQRGRCQKSDILNTLGYNEFYEWLTKR